jgi:hypothetical protein
MASANADEQDSREVSSAARQTALVEFRRLDDSQRFEHFVAGL